MRVRTWNHLFLEGYCGRFWDYDEKHSEYLYLWSSDDDFTTPEKKLNPKYDPKIRVPRKPKYCKDEISLDCVKCPHFVYSEIDDDLKLRLEGTIREYMSETGEV